MPVKLSGISFPSGTEIFGSSYSVSVDKDQFRIRKSRFGLPLFLLFPLFDILLAAVFLIRQYLGSHIAAVVESNPNIQVLAPVFPYIPVILVVVEGGVIGYLLFSLNRTRPWHGTEHKAIAAAMAGDLDNISNYSVINDRCGGCFLFSMYLGMALWLAIVRIPIGLFTVSTLILYTEAKYFHQYNKPGIWLGRKIQLLTTKEPSPEMLGMGERGVRALLVRMRNEPVRKSA